MNVIVIPTYKERETLRHMLPKLIKLLRKDDVVLLIDDTKDFETKQFHSRQIRVLPRIRKKRGYGTSLKQGLMLGCFVFNAEYIIQCDADHNPDDLKTFYQHLPMQEDYIIGYEEGRKLMRMVVAWLSKRLGITLRHPSCGFKLYKNDTLKSLEWHKIKASGFDIQIELAYHLTRMQFTPLELPIQPNDRRFDKSKLSLRQVVKHLQMFRRLMTKHLYRLFISILKGE